MKLKIKYNKLSRGFYLLLLIELPFFSLAADQANALFQKGNQLYAKAQYQQAAQTYQQLLKNGYTSADVYFNMGDAYYKLEDMPSAILYYEKARKLAPNDQEISINIQFANLKISDKIEPQPDFFVSRWWHNFILILSANTLSIISDLFFLGGFLLLIVYLFANSILLKKAAFYFGFVAILIGLISIFMANRQVDYFNTHHQAIIFSSAITVKGSPSANAKPLFVIHEGTKVDVTQKNGNWIEIELPNGNSGWITADNVKYI